MKIAADLFEDTATAFAAKSTAELQKARWLFQLIANNQLVTIGSGLADFALKIHLPVAPLFRYTVYDHFCGGETFEECKGTLQKLSGQRVAAMLNYGVELKESEEDFEKTIEKNLEAIAFAGSNETARIVCIKLTGFGRFALYEKIQSGKALTKKETSELDQVKARLRRLCDSALEKKVQLYVDAEESWIQDALDELVDEVMPEYNRQQAILFNTFQFYRHDRLAYLKKCTVAAQKKGFILGAKIVRGAYMEKERKRAEELDYPSPIHVNKEAVDMDFNSGLSWCLEHLEHVALCIASQSEASNLLAVKTIVEKKIAPKHPHIVFSQLYGMGDNITFNLAKAGFNAYKYLPYGPVKEVIPYLIRRAQENTSVGGQTGRELGLIQQELKRRKNER
ncbi:MAG: proline dehydrogenase family protein [Chitinophagales bacterium]